MESSKEMASWRLPLNFTVAAICLIIDLFISRRVVSFFFAVAFGAVFMGTVFGWSDYLKKRGLKSGRSLPGKLLSDGEDRSE